MYLTETEAEKLIEEGKPVFVAKANDGGYLFTDTPPQPPVEGANL
jgi:hypothetical protein